MEVNKNSTRDAEGLQAVENENFPEVVPEQQAPSRRNSMTSPEAFNVEPQHYDPDPKQPFYQNEKGAYVPVPMNDFQGQRPSTSGPPQYGDHETEKQLAGGVVPAGKDKKILGMRRKVFIWVAAVVIFLIVLAAVLGGVLGTVLNNNDSSDSKNSNNATGQFQIKDKSGLAMLSTSAGIYTYYMDESGSIVETNFGSDWNKNNTALPSSTNVTTGADPNSPIAAVTYALQGSTTYRHLFYFNSEGKVMAINTTGSDWKNSTAYAPIATRLSSQQGTIGLTAVAATGQDDGFHLNGIRVYFGSSQGVVQEIGCDFSIDQAVWHVWATFDGSDASSGVSSVVINEMNHLYLRNATTGSLQQWTWDYTVPGPWTLGAASASDNGVVEGGSIAAATDGSNTDYIFYQTTGSSTGVAQYSGSATSIDTPSMSVGSLQSAPVGYPLAATYSSSEGAVVLNQNSQNTAQLLFASVSRDGSSQDFTTDTGSGS